VTVDLPAAYVGVRRASAHARQRREAGLPTALSVLIEGRTKITLEREWRLTLALALRQQLPRGACLAVTGTDGRGCYIGPATTHGVPKTREA
jgi:hypothetical protein